MPQGSRDSGTAGAPMLEVRGVSKTFQGQRALHDVDLELRQGEIHCLLGQNGSGKSTLIKILAGFHAPDDGSTAASIGGAPFELGSAAAAHKAGLRFIHQDLALIDQLSLVDNLALGGGYEGRWWLSDRRERRRAHAIMAEYGVEIDASQAVAALGPAQKAMTAIVRALHDGNVAAGVLVLDEPTASLTAQDKDHLFRLLRDVRAQGGTILYVTHRLNEVLELADRVSVLRDGQNVATTEVAGLDHDGLVELILGGPLESQYAAESQPAGDVLLEIDQLRHERLKDFTGTVHAGEVVGIVGLAGSGAEDVLRVVFGAEKRESGDVRLRGKAIAPRTPSDGIRDGLAFGPADTKGQGGIQGWTLRENVTLPRIKGRGPLRWLGRRAEAADVEPFLERCQVRPLDTEATLSSLSGGNQQKVVIAKWLRSGAEVFLLEDPTAGVDVGGRSAIYHSLRDVAAEGGAVLMYTTDFEEACGVCDRVYVVRDGRSGRSRSTEGLTVDALLSEMLRSSDPSSEEAGRA